MRGWEHLHKLSCKQNPWGRKGTVCVPGGWDICFAHSSYSWPQVHLLDDDPLFIYSLAEDFPEHLCDLKEKSVVALEGGKKKTLSCAVNVNLELFRILVSKSGAVKNFM